MNKSAIIVENISKRYRIGVKEELHDTLVGSLISWIKYPLSNFRRVQKLSKFGGNDNSKDIIWALRDVSFNVKQGEVLGVIGKNGAGKSTLLKILCRITEPTSGNASIHGRVASLLEVGTGFHPELTGRENIFLNGTILGMTKAEIEQKFDEIVDFSGVEKFIDTPVKRYSSGMHVRLAFSVAAHLEPEILLVDEVLAVGDVEFQKQCLGKMRDITGEGRTVLFVSHNMASIEKLCHEAILIEKGTIRYKGPVRETIDIYLVQNENLPSSAEITGSEEKHKILKSIRLLNDRGEQSGVFSVGEKIIFELLLDSCDAIIRSPRILIGVANRKHGPICCFSSDQMNSKPFTIKGKSVIQCIWNECYLIPGSYYISLKFQGFSVESIPAILKFEIKENDIYNTGKEISGNPDTVILPKGEWEFNSYK